MSEAQRNEGPLDRRVGRLWRVVRHIREEYEVEAESRADALMLVQDPHNVVVTSQSCTEVKMPNAKDQADAA